MRNVCQKINSYPPKGRVGLYDPYLDVLGGGEKHILSILQVLADEGYEPYIFWDEDLREKIKKQFSLPCFKRLKFLPNIFKNKKNWLQKLFQLKNFDIFFYVNNGSFFFSSAKKNFVFCMVPKKELYQMNLINRLKTFNFKFITNSVFTQKWLSQWGIKSKIIYPYIDEKLIKTDLEKIKKEKIILSVGRFYKHLHSKQHEKIIETFKKIRRSQEKFKYFKLILVGGLKEEDRDYFNHLKKIIANHPSIKLKPNISFNELLTLYKKSQFYWHFTGFGVDEDKQPEMVEHLGIAPLEAMASGCITFCYNAGGPKEIIKDSQNGFLFNNEEELIKKTLLVLNNKTWQKKIIFSAKNFIKENFSYSMFAKRIKKIILEI